MTLEAVLLTGGASRRMGRDKALLVVDGETLADRMVRKLTVMGLPVTVLGRTPVSGAAFRADEEEFAGPLSALERFSPSAQGVFVGSCDMPLFDGRILDILVDRIGEADAAVPVVGRWRQPLCALYRASAFGAIPRARRRSMMGWLELLVIAEVQEEQLGVEPSTLGSANTPEELSTLLAKGKQP